MHNVDRSDRTLVQDTVEVLFHSVQRQWHNVVTPVPVRFKPEFSRGYGNLNPGNEPEEPTMHG